MRSGSSTGIAEIYSRKSQWKYERNKYRTIHKYLYTGGTLETDVGMFVPFCPGEINPRSDGYWNDLCVPGGKRPPFGVAFRSRFSVPVDAVYAVAHAIHELVVDECGPEFVFCDKIRPAPLGPQLLKYIRNVSFHGTYIVHPPVERALLSQTHHINMQIDKARPIKILIEL